MDAELLQRPLIFVNEVAAEDQIRVGAAMQPSVFLDLGLELSGSPSGIAERQQRAVGAVAFGDRLEDIEGGGEADAVVDGKRRVLDEEVAGMQHETAARLDRPALEHLDR